MSARAFLLQPGSGAPPVQFEASYCTWRLNSHSSNQRRQKRGISQFLTPVDKLHVARKKSSKTVKEFAIIRERRSRIRAVAAQHKYGRHCARNRRRWKGKGIEDREDDQHCILEKHCSGERLLPQADIACTSLHDLHDRSEYAPRNNNATFYKLYLSCGIKLHEIGGKSPTKEYEVYGISAIIKTCIYLPLITNFVIIASNKSSQCGDKSLEFIRAYTTSRKLHPCDRLLNF